MNASPSLSTQLLLELGQLLGFYVSGDVGDLTLYTTARGRIVAFPRTRPDKPPTAAQLHQRARFAAAQSNYMREPPATKQLWEQATILLGVDLTGQNAYISQSLNPDPSVYQTITRKTGISLTPPTIINP